VNEIELSQAVEDITPQSDAAAVVNLIGLVKERQKALKLLKDKAEDALITILETKPGRCVTVGAVKYFAGDKKTTKCRSNKAVADELYGAAMSASGGDYEAGSNRFVAMLMDCLCSDAFKPGETWKQLELAALEVDADTAETVADEAWGRAFVETIKTEIKEGKEKAVREVRTIHPLFMEKRR
jgi:hypothetical protein